MKNFGFADLRLVSPLEFDPKRIEGVAHGTADLIERIRLHDDLPGAVADCVYVVGLTARHRAVRRNAGNARDAAEGILSRSAEGRVALVLGPEDRGLSNDDLDLCDASVTIDTTEDHPSLNLAQAFTVVAYELFMTAGERRDFKPPRRDAPVATSGELEQLFPDVEASLAAYDFFKSKNSRAIMRTLREIAHRASLDQREVRLVRGIALELRHYLKRLADPPKTDVSSDE